MEFSVSVFQGASALTDAYFYKIFKQKSRERSSLRKPLTFSGFPTIIGLFNRCKEAQVSFLLPATFTHQCVKIFLH
jgi:hypothetical protein